jgi:hypothetical protein
MQMKRLIYTTVFTAVLLIGVTPVWADIVFFKGSVTIPFKSGLFTSEPPAELRAEAIERGKITAWKKYVSQFSGAKRDLYRKHENDFLTNISAYVTEVKVLDESVANDPQSLTTTVRITIDEGAVESAMRENFGAGSQASGDASTFAFVFVARELQSRKTYQDKVIDVKQTEQIGLAENKIAVSGASSSESLDQSSTSKSVSGGSSEQKRAKLTYQVTSSQDINASMSNVLSTAGYEIVEYDDVVSNCGGAERTVIMQEFSENDDMSRGSRNAAINGSHECDVSLFATGTLDVGLSEVDPVSGMQRVFVSTRAQVWSLTKKLPRKVASVGPVQFSGLGPDAQVAMRNALNLAAEEAAKEIVAILNSKGIR